ncbi:glycine receptor subunit alpha-4-like [Folsomia candida]|uniref:glycine receptor subunit alpha-4-like n=1 Tax=Folsomia candida TaxID=158441 RepID=UPI001604B0D9|nr:glycine receptor subunit alpha-4-like [Folsomia candida]
MQSVLSSISLILLVITSCCESSRRARTNRQNEVPPYAGLSEYHSDFYDTVFGPRSDYLHSRVKRSIPHCTTADGCIKDVLKLPEGYNFFDIPFPPSSGDKQEPINVTMKARVESIREINEVKEEITLDMEITLGWTDWKILAHRKNLTKDQVIQFIAEGKHLDRLGNLVTINNPEYLKSIWKPNLYIYNLIEKTQPRLMTDLITLKFDPDGGFLYYLTRVLLKLSCPMKFHYFPADTQTCEFLIRGFSYNENLLNLQWYKGPYLADRDESNFDVQLSGYEFRKLKRRAEIYNGLSFKLSLRRRLSYHMVQTYIPSSFFILITWLCFLIPSTMVEARIGISMTTLLTLTAMFASVRETSPISSYVKALDVWMVSCIFSVFLTLLEFSILAWNDEKEKKRKKAQKAGRKSGIRAEAIELSELMYNKADPLIKDNFADLDDDEEEKDKFKTYSEIIEKYAFFTFLCLFIFYNAGYWTWLFKSSGFYDWGAVDTTLNVGDNEGETEL